MVAGSSGGTDIALIAIALSLHGWMEIYITGIRRQPEFKKRSNTCHLKGVAEDLYRLEGGREAALLLLAAVSSRGTERGTEEERSVRFSCARTLPSARAD